MQYNFNGILFTHQFVTKYVFLVKLFFFIFQIAV